MVRQGQSAAPTSNGAEPLNPEPDVCELEDDGAAWTLNIRVLREWDEPEELEPLRFDQPPILPGKTEFIRVADRLLQVAIRRFAYHQLGCRVHTTITLDVLALPERATVSNLTPAPVDIEIDPDGRVVVKR